MRVLQLIDALEAGGAERVAVNIANALAVANVPSYLVATRGEGPLKNVLGSKVHYTFLARKTTLDIRALIRLRTLIIDEKITHIHAHSTSYFVASIIKIFTPQLKLVCHLHEGKKVQTGAFDNKLLFLCSFLFSGILTVNEDLAVWARKTLNVKNVLFVLNFIPSALFDDISEEKKKTVVCLANLRKPKNHILLLKAWNKINTDNWTLKLIGADYNDAYSSELKKYIQVNNLENSVGILGLRTDANILLNEASIGILTSTSEGLPMALLEYGAASLAVITTDVGQCAKVVGSNGCVINSNDEQQLISSLKEYIKDETLRKRVAITYKEQIKTNFTERAILPKIQAFYSSI